MFISKFFDFNKFFTPAYLFATSPASLSRPFMLTWVAAGLGLALAGVLVKIYAWRRIALSRAKVRWWRRVGTHAIFGGIFFLFLLFLRYERTTFFGARFWIIIWFALVVFDFGYLLWQLRVRVPAAVAEEERRYRLQKYLP